MERRRQYCSPDAWHNLLAKMNKDSDVVEVRKADLLEVADCHVRCGYTPPRDLVVDQNRSRVEVRRQSLWNLMQAHGHACGKGFV